MVRRLSCYLVRIVRSQLLIVFCFVAGVAGFCQAPAAPPQSLPKDPQAILAMAAPYYDFSDRTLKPWHLKATYQLYDEKSNPTEQGTFEYWWASPEVYRATWTRPGATRIDWHTADGKHSYKATGERLNFFEFKLLNALLSPLPESGDLELAKSRLYREDKKLGSAKFPCIMVIPIMPLHGQVQNVPIGLFPTYCFDPDLPALRISYSLGTVVMEFNRIAKVQNRFLARELMFFEGQRQILSAKVELIEGLSPADPALRPSVDAETVSADKAQLAAGVTTGMLLKKQVPFYPQDAKDARVSGKVVLAATIGVDGGIHEMHVLEAPWPSLAASTMWAVSQWEYKPYLVNGEPVEVETTINVIFTLGR